MSRKRAVAVRSRSSRRACISRWYHGDGITGLPPSSPSGYTSFDVKILGIKLDVKIVDVERNRDDAT
jgi:hypothetical protein